MCVCVGEKERDSVYAMISAAILFVSHCRTLVKRTLILVELIVSDTGKLPSGSDAIV